MCRWLAYSGSPVLIEELLYRPTHSLIDQSLHSDLGAEPTNGDGFGLGWYDAAGKPALFRSVEPAWNEANLRELSAHVSSPLVLAHVRASSGSPVQLTNCHPFRHGRWLWMHNGVVRQFPTLKRELVLAVDPSLYPDIAGSTDSEILFFLALTFGLEEDPPMALARTVGLVEATGRLHRIEHPIQMTIATTNGQQLWAFRYSSEGRSRTLYVSSAIETLRALYPDTELFARADLETRLVVSEPLSSLPGAWNELPESSWGVVQPGGDELHEFTPEPPYRRNRVTRRSARQLSGATP